MKNKIKKEEKRYCRLCGAEMVTTYVPDREEKYDPFTGKPVRKGYTIWKCPNKRIFFDKHSQWDDAPDYGVGTF